MRVCVCGSVKRCLLSSERACVRTDAGHVGGFGSAPLEIVAMERALTTTAGIVSGPTMTVPSATSWNH